MHSLDVFSAWRFFSIGNPSIGNFTATIIPNPVSAGNLAMRLDYDNTVASAGTDWGLDRWDSRIPVTYGTGYTISFDAAHISGGTTLEFLMRESVNDVFVSMPLLQNVVVSDVNYRHYAFNYTPSVPNVTIDVRFKPLDTGAERTMSLSLDNFHVTPLGCLNGSFEAQTAGTTASSGGGDIVDGGTFSNWRFFSVGTPAGSVSTGTIVSEATDHNVGFRYDVNNAGGSPVDYALDKDNSKVPVVYGTRYKVSFDAAHISGGTFLSFGIGEHRSDGVWTGRGTDIPVTVANPDYQTYSYFWTPLDPSTALANLAFRIRPTGGFTTVSMRFDNIRLERAVAPVTLGNLLQVYDGTAKSVSVATEPPGLAVGLTYNGSSSAPSGLGSYTVVGTVLDANYEPTSVTNTLLIVTPLAPIPDGSFEAQTLDATVGGNYFIDSTTFAPWRVFNVSPAGGAYFTGTVVSAASDGVKAMRLEVGNPDLYNGFCVLDRDVWGKHLPVAPGTRYLVSFDAARLSGSPKLRVHVSEFGYSDEYLNQSGSFFLDIPGTNYQRHSFIWTPLAQGTAQISLGFTPWCVPTNTTASYLLDNVSLTPLGEVALRDLTQVYDGTPKSASAVTDPAGLPVSFTYNGSSTAPSNGGVYTVVATVTNALYACSVTGTLLIKDAAVPQLKTNGSFEAQPAGTTLSFSGPDSRGDESTFSGWRFFNVGAPAILNFTATIVSSATEGGKGMRLSLSDDGSGVACDHALDNNNARVAVAYGTRYRFSFDAAHDEGSRHLYFGIAEFDSGGNFLGQQTSYQVYVCSTNYQNSSFIWTPENALTKQTVIRLMPVSWGPLTTAVMRFDNVRVDPLVATVTLTQMEHAFTDPSKLPGATTAPGGLPVTFTYDGSPTAPTAPGRYTVVGTVSDAYFTGSATGTLILHGPLGTMLMLN